MANNTGNWVLTSEGMVAAPAVGARRVVRRDIAVAADDQPMTENTLLLLVAMLPLLVAAVTVVAG